MSFTCTPNFRIRARRRPLTGESLNILLTNGRFPVTLDLARQLKKCGHTVYVVDCMHYHVGKFSNAVRQSFRAPAPHDNQSGYRAAVASIIRSQNIDLVIPMHEEIIHLSGATDPEILTRLLAPPKNILLRLHNKWEFSQWVQKLGLGVPVHYLCESAEDVRGLPGLADGRVEYVLKPVFGRASQNVFHLKGGAGEVELGKGMRIDQLDIGAGRKWIAQEWVYGERYCSYSVIRDGKVQAFSLYKVLETIDGSSCVYFRSVEHQGIFDYVSDVATELGLEGVTGAFQLAFDFIEGSTNPLHPETDARLVAIECNPRCTSGVHLFASRADLARALTDASSPRVVANAKAKRQVFPGMMMWEHSDATVKQWLRHMGRLMGSKDVVFSGKDLLPTLMQPFLLTSYYEICREKKLRLPDMFQLDVTWEPDAAELEEVAAIAREDRERWARRRGVLSEQQAVERRSSVMAGGRSRGLSFGSWSHHRREVAVEAAVETS
ncbi:hypothetical protein Dda_1725 [Drechslerella dactyloides]|uniref:ATP-grasp domain-containing protein n=1 Tax=Drechslerella dactyloides TaxID=74499 RepID=A0AAD6J403_DREDA|nr:hypothetical protein Dda_1725 [Drechslerella dactyloides]